MSGQIVIQNWFHRADPHLLPTMRTRFINNLLIETLGRKDISPWNQGNAALTILTAENNLIVGVVSIVSEDSTDFITLVDATQDNIIIKAAEILAKDMG